MKILTIMGIISWNHNYVGQDNCDIQCSFIPCLGGTRKTLARVWIQVTILLCLSIYIMWPLIRHNVQQLMVILNKTVDEWGKPGCSKVTFNESTKTKLLSWPLPYSDLLIQLLYTYQVWYQCFLSIKVIIKEYFDNNMCINFDSVIQYFI